jgi:prolipoprotein diacylglyceryltransferase
MLPILQIGPLAIQTPGLILLGGLWLGLSLSERHARRYKADPGALYNLIFILLIAGILGARLAYVARYPQAFLANPISLVSLNPGLLDPGGGAAAAFIAGLIFGQRKAMPFWSTLDALTPALAVLGAAIPLANLASGAAFGAPTSLPWAIELWGAERHPTQIYQAIAAGFILWYLWPGRREPFLPDGATFLYFLALSAGVRLFLEAFRGDSVVVAYGLRIAQIYAWGILATSLWGIWKRKVSTKGNQLR